MAEETDWIEWAGGECPVPADTRVFVQLRWETREGAESVPMADTADAWVWAHRQHPHHRGDIIAYRVVKP